MNILIVFLLGVFIGTFVTRWIDILRAPLVGNLRIDSSDPTDGPYMFLEITKDVGLLYSKKQVTLNINTESYIR